MLSIDKAITALPESQLIRDLAEPSYRELVSEMVGVMQLWKESWGALPTARSFLNKSALCREVEECVVPLHFIASALQQRQTSGPAQDAFFLALPAPTPAKRTRQRR